MSTTEALSAAPSTCHTDTPAPTRQTRRRRMRRLALHSVEMVIAMAVGMVALHPI